MYSPAHFTEQDFSLAIELMTNNPFATLTSVCPTSLTPVISLLPMIYNGDSNKLYMHFAKANPHQKLLNQACTVMFMGDDSYISPDWTNHLARNDQIVPTWNYSALQINGYLAEVNEAEKAQHLATQVDYFEQKDSSNWSMNLLSATQQANMLKAITVCQISITDWQLKTKLSQNKSVETRQSIVDKIAPTHPQLAQQISATI